MYKIKIYRINDEQDINDFLIIILKIIHKKYKILLNEFWKISVGVQAGYGETVCSIEEDVLKFKQLEILGSKIYNALVFSREYFFNVSIIIDSQKIEFGIFDSYYVYLFIDNLFIVNYIIKEIFYNKNAKIEIIKNE